MKIRDLYSDSSKWTQHGFTCDGCSWCLDGAILHCYPASNERDKIRNHILVLLGLEGRSKLWSWNDDPKRTFDEVKTVVEELDI